MKNNIVIYSLRISREYMDKLGVIALYNERSKNQEITFLIRSHIQKFEAEHGKIEEEQPK